MNDKVINLFGGEQADSRGRTSKQTKKTNPITEGEIDAAVHAVIDISLKRIAIKLKDMDREDAEIVLAEIDASMLRVERATQLAKLRS